MNFLAHLYLAGEDEGLLIGNFLADLIRQKEVANLPETVQRGIQLHRKIDSYTDQHPIVKQGTRRLYEVHHKYAPVIIDIFYDYFLAKNWQLYSNTLLQPFAMDCYRVLEKHIDLMSLPLQRKTQQMVDRNWLISYGQREGLRKTFQRVEQRVSRPDYFQNVLQSFDEQHDLLDREFQLFFPDMIAFVQAEIANQ